MVPVASIEHQLPGRVRLRVPSKRGDVPFFEKVVRELSKHPSLRELTASSLTASITLHYREPLQPITGLRRTNSSSKLVDRNHKKEASRNKFRGCAKLQA